MSCIKTGGCVFLPSHNTYLICDIYAVGDSRIIRFTHDMAAFFIPPRPVTHVADLNSGEDNFIHKLAGIIVVKACDLKEES